MSPPFPLQVRHKRHKCVTILHSGPQKTAVPKNPENSGQCPFHVWTSPCLRKRGGGLSIPPTLMRINVCLKSIQTFYQSYGNVHVNTKRMHSIRSTHGSDHKHQCNIDAGPVGNSTKGCCTKQHLAIGKQHIYSQGCSTQNCERC